MSHSSKQLYSPSTVYTRVQVNFWGREKGAPRSTLTYIYFLPAEGRMFSAIFDTQTLLCDYRIQPNKSQSHNKIITLLPTNPLLFNK